MKLNKKFFLKLGLYLTLTGLIISFLGYALSGFSLHSYDRSDDVNRPWYQVVDIWND